MYYKFRVYLIERVETTNRADSHRDQIDTGMDSFDCGNFAFCESVDPFGMFNFSNALILENWASHFSARFFDVCLSGRAARVAGLLVEKVLLRCQMDVECCWYLPKYFPQRFLALGLRSD